ncbi:glutathione S-transferase family protein [Sulfitobacter sp. S190]|uniref:glutathione S-transferase family protein n=1 Tax=Sulfitobacter sp. S190 TaxID=2867022 RepID=UPI0021A7088C|nr:glutathione S-transferase family protein [Sulfitobacter sp. S190]UWR22395.1 glutathione S-transferase family protein [Sulfitobacter sp. S190]
MLTLLTFGPAFGEISASPFSIKAIWLLNLSGQPWQRRVLTDPRKMPKGKLPALEVDGGIIADSDDIRGYLESQGHDFETGLSDLDKANARAFIRMAEEHMYFHQVLDRWGNDAIWAVIREQFFADVPRPLRGLVSGSLRKKLLRGMHVQGLGRLSAAERLARVEPDLTAIAARLWQGKFLFGDRPSAADTSVGAMLCCMMSAPVQTPLSRRIADDPVLGAYAQRCRDAMGG